MNVHLINIPASLWPVWQKAVDALGLTKGGVSESCRSLVCRCMFVRQIFVSFICRSAFHSKQFFFPFHQKTTFSFSSNVQKGFGQSLFVCRLTKCHWCPAASIIKLVLQLQCRNFSATASINKKPMEPWPN